MSIENSVPAFVKPSSSSLPFVRRNAITILNFQRNSAMAPSTPARFVQGGPFSFRGTLAAQLRDALGDDCVLAARGRQQVERSTPRDEGFGEATSPRVLLGFRG